MGKNDFYLRFEDPSTDRWSDALGPFTGPLVLDGLTLKDAHGNLLATSTLDDDGWDNPHENYTYSDIVIWVGLEGAKDRSLMGFRFVSPTGAGHAHEKYEWVQLTYQELRISPDGDWVAGYDDGEEAGWYHYYHDQRPLPKVELYAA